MKELNQFELERVSGGEDYPTLMEYLGRKTYATIRAATALGTGFVEGFF